MDNFDWFFGLILIKLISDKSSDDTLKRWRIIIEPTGNTNNTIDPHRKWNFFSSQATVPNAFRGT